MAGAAFVQTLPWSLFALVGTGLARGLERRFGATALLRAGLLLEAATHLTLAATRNAWVAAAILVVFGVHTMVWGVIAATVRQRATPDRLLAGAWRPLRGA